MIVPRGNPREPKGKTMDYRFSSSFANLAPSAIREILKNAGDPSVIAFAAGNPNAASFPLHDIRRLVSDILETKGPAALQYGTTEGYTPLRETVAKRQKERFSVGRDFDDVLITSGGQQALELACRVFCDPGDAVICEDPSFIGALNAFRGVGARVVGVPLESDGMNTEALEEKLKSEPNARLIYVITNFQNPAGVTTSLAKRKEIYRLAKRYGVMILEDNPYGELRFSGEDIPTIKSMDDDGIVIYASSFSKILSSGMRVGFAVAPKPVVAKMTVCKQTEDVHTNLLFQMLCHRFMTECDFDAHVQSIRDLYRKKCGIMLNAMERNFPADVAFTRPEGGLFVWCTLPEKIDLLSFVKRAMEKKVAVVPGTAFATDTQKYTAHSFRVTYATPTDEQLAEGVAILGDLVREMTK